MTEKNMQTMFSNYIKFNKPNTSEVYELKIVKGTALPFDRVAEHQIDALVNAATGVGLYWKIPDMAAKSGYAAPKPYDCQYICRAKAYLIIWFYKPKQKKQFYKVGIFEWNRMRGIVSSHRKSFTEDVIASIAEEVINI